MEDNETKKEYNKIASHFSKTRFRTWPEMEEFASYIKDGMKIADLGCGNGRLLQALEGKNISYLGIDNSKELIKKAKEKYPKKKFQAMDMRDLELKDKEYDAVFAIASLHHLPTKKDKQKAISEASRILKKEGYFFITVWNLWQKRFLKYFWQSFMRKLKGKENSIKDLKIPFKNQERKVLGMRYYYAFTKKELEKDLKRHFKVEKIENNGRNIIAICRKD